MTSYLQADPRWGRDTLGHGDTTLAAEGCLVTCAASIVSDVGRAVITPGELNAHLIAQGGFVDGLGRVGAPGANRFVFDSLRAFGVALQAFGICRMFPAPVAVLRADLPGRALIVEVDYRPGGALDNHWVRVLEFCADGDALIMDPLVSGPQRLLARYGAPGWDLARAIFAHAMYESIETSR